MANSSSQQYALIIGNGRSGTNWLLSILDASPLTHCRNEPHDILDSPFHSLPDAWELRDNPALMDEKWDSFVNWTGTHMGERDHRIANPKAHVYPLAQQLGIAYWPVRPKIRRLLQMVLPELRQGEWKMPWWIGSQAKLDQAHAIIKINDLRAWIVRWLLKNRSDVPIIHIIRHPGGYLNSIISRFFSHLNPEQLESERSLYQSILRTAVQLDPQWAAQFGDIESMSLIEAVTWFWRYNNEEIYRTLQHYPNYMLVVYEELAMNPLKYAEKVYDFCQIPWNQSVEDLIQAGTKTSVWGKLSDTSAKVSVAWKSELSQEYQTLTKRVLNDSLMEDWWK